MLKREIYLKRIRPAYDVNIIKILLGIRRSGKSTILLQIQDELKEKGVKDDHIIYLSFEETRNDEYRDGKILHKYIEEKIKDNDIYYVFLDEIQNVQDFERYINSLNATFNNISIFVTGSNSRLLSGELSTVLSGRYISYKIYPFSYKEYIKYTGKDARKLETLYDYLNYGGLPQRFKFNESKAIFDYILSVYNTIILRDIVERLGLKDIQLFDRIIQYIIDTTGREFSIENIIKYLSNSDKDVSPTTIYAYLDALEKAFIIQKVNRYDVHGKHILKTLNKYYMTDLGISQIKYNDKTINRSFAIENLVYNELVTRGYNVYTGKLKQGEVDFVVDNNKERKYIQVTTYLTDDKVIEREFGAFNKIEDNYPKYVISLDELDYSQKGIKHINLFNFLLLEDF